MTDNSSKLWLQSSLNKLAITRAQQAIEATGSALPCRVVAVSGSIVTVAFEVNSAPWTLPQITIPKAESGWMRSPTQVGDFGVTVPADVYLGGVSGLGGGTAEAIQPTNLSALFFVPISNTNSPPIDQDAAQIQGPNGAIIRTTEGTPSSVVTNREGTTVTFGDASLTVNADGIAMNFGGKSVTLTPAGLTIDGIVFDTHVHEVVAVGSPTLGPEA